MSYLYLDSVYIGDPRMYQISDKQFRAHIRMAAWLARWEMTEFCERQALNICGINKSSVQRLVDAGVWKREKDDLLSLAEFERGKLGFTSKRLETRPTASRHLPRLLERDGYWCGICDSGIEEGESIHVDHIVPRSRGGSDEIPNLQLAHKRCNIWKGTRLQSELDYAECPA